MTVTDNAVLLIKLNGTNAGANANGLHFVGGSSSVSGLVINRFSKDGIFLTGDSNVIAGNFIGTDATGTIDLGNGSSGVESVWDLNSSSGNLVGGFAAERNIISGNGYAGDGDSGANNLQNFPVITNALSAGTIIDGTLNGAPNTTFRLEFFVSPAADPSGYGEGKMFVGAINVTTNGAGDVVFSNSFGGIAPLNSCVSATATNIVTGDTSEFSNSSLVH